MKYFGVTDKVFYSEFLSNNICFNCNKDLDTKLIVHCEAFVTGPVTWWAWKKQGYTECINCGQVAALNGADRVLPDVRNLYSRRSIPFSYFVPTGIVGLVLLAIIGLVSIGMIYQISTNSKDRFEGAWLNKDGSSALFVFNNGECNLLEQDTIIFGFYTFDKKADVVHTSIAGKDDELKQIDIRNIKLTVMYGLHESFSKIISSNRGENPYQAKYNNWRKKPDHSESDAEIKQRVIDYLTFLKTRYEWVLSNKLNRLPPDFNSPLFEAQNGIALYEKDYGRWRSIYFSEENYLSGNAFLRASFPRNYKMDEKETNVFKQNLGLINAYIENAKRTTL